ncbi:MAG: phosphate ABC transporter permease PstA [Armatimonadota bacterium]|nr:phosphate ABC transporter permease PstA [Armatimonadota bacterium]
MKERSITTRKAVNGVVTAAAGAAAVFGLAMLLWILGVVILRGIAAIDWSFFTQLPSPPGESGGGVANAIVGTFIITVVAAIIGVPLGVLAGTYVAEFGRDSRFASAIRFCANTLMGAPSIVVGVFVYTFMVVPMGRFSGIAGSVALAIIMLPIVARTTEDMLRLVPNSLRESALALGAPEHNMIVQVVFRAARSGMLTGIMLAVARVSGETAPLLFTTLNSPYWTVALDKPMANLTVTIFNYAMSPYTDWQAKAWGASLLITATVLIMNLAARAAARERRFGS